MSHDGVLLSNLQRVANLDQYTGQGTREGFLHIWECAHICGVFVGALAHLSVCMCLGALMCVDVYGYVSLYVHVSVYMCVQGQ